MNTDSALLHSPRPPAPDLTDYVRGNRHLKMVHISTRVGRASVVSLPPSMITYVSDLVDAVQKEITSNVYRSMSRGLETRESGSKVGSVVSLP
jgi:hypothetical protein